MAHFHYTIMGGLIFAFMAGCYYWLPKMMGIKLNETLGKWHFWLMFIAFNSTFLPLFAVGLAGQPRRVFEYARNLQTLNDWVSISSFFLGGVDPDLRDQLRLVDGDRQGARGRQPVELARAGVADDVAAAARTTSGRAGRAVRPVRVRGEGRAAGRRHEPAGRSAHRGLSGLTGHADRTRTSGGIDRWPRQPPLAPPA